MQEKTHNFFYQISKFSNAVNLFTNFISDNGARIIETDPIKDYCLCLEISYDQQSDTLFSSLLPIAQ